MQKISLLIMTLFLFAGLHAQDSVSVLFIGNSYTYANDLPGMLEQLAESAGKTVFTGSKTNGGFTFQNHAGDPQTYAAMHQYPWDVVVLQAQSQEPSFPDVQVDTQTLPYARQLSDSVYAIHPCSNVLYFMTWGRENGDPQWGPIATFEGMNARLYNAYLRMADSTDAMVSAVGAVWKYVRDHHPSVQLYSGDGSHPSVAGSYLAACTFYTSLFRSPVTGTPFSAGLDAQTASWLQMSADMVILDSLDHFRLHPVDEPVQAAFAESINGMTVTFNNTSVRGEWWSWDFGDGAETALEHPVHTYASSGVYDVRLTAGNSCTSDTVWKQVAVGIGGTNLLDPAAYELLEFGDHFELTAIAKPLYYEIYNSNGKIIISDFILTSEKSTICKKINTGIIVLKNEQAQRFFRTFVLW